MTLMKKRIASILVVVALVALGVIVTKVVIHRDAKPPVEASARVGTVAITEDGFVPETLHVKTGTTVLWTNVDTAPHRVAANPYGTHTSLPGLDSKINLSTNKTYRYTFTKSGTYGYHDELNPSWNATVVVD